MGEGWYESFRKSIEDKGGVMSIRGRGMMRDLGPGGKLLAFGGPQRFEFRNDFFRMLQEKAELDVDEDWIFEVKLDTGTILKCPLNPDNSLQFLRQKLGAKGTETGVTIFGTSCSLEMPLHNQIVLFRG